MLLELRRIVTSLQIKECKTHVLFVSDLKMYRRMRLCVTVKKHTHAHEEEKCNYMSYKNPTVFVLAFWMFLASASVS